MEPSLNFGIEIEIILKKTDTFIKKFVDFASQYSNFLDLIDKTQKNGLQYLSDTKKMDDDKLKRYHYIVSNEKFIRKLDQHICWIHNEKNKTEIQKQKEMFENYLKKLKIRYMSFSYIICLLLCNQNNNQNKKRKQISSNLVMFSHYIYNKKRYGEKFTPLGCNETTPYNWIIDYDASVKLRVIQDNESLESGDFEICDDKLYDNIKTNNTKTLCSSEVIPHIEFVSSIFNSVNDVKIGCSLLFENLEKLFEDENLCFNNIQTSNHVHFSCKTFQFIDNPDFVYIYSLVFLYLQSLIFMICHPSRTNNKYCKPIEYTHYNISDINLNNYYDKYVDKINSSSSGSSITKKHKKIANIAYSFQQDKSLNAVDRYSILNLKNLSVKDGLPTMEIRAKHGSNDPEEISNYCELLEKIFQKVHHIYLQCHENKTLSIKKEILKVFPMDYLNDIDIYYKNIFEILYDNDTTKVNYWIEHISHVNEIKKK